MKLINIILFFLNSQVQRIFAKKYRNIPALPDGFIYRSDLNKEYLNVEQLRAMIKGLNSHGYLVW